MSMSLSLFKSLWKYACNICLVRVFSTNKLYSSLLIHFDLSMSWSFLSLYFKSMCDFFYLPYPLVRHTNVLKLLFFVLTVNIDTAFDALYISLFILPP
uniref:Putative ovule protein n=1 Tax=Solanum chacoense TaxID=4108 RepID=A0A0V0IUX5_SOLCH